MSKRGLAALYQALNEALGPHISSETLAEIASAEAANENIDVLYPAEVHHIETCPKCAEAYAGLAEMMLAVIGDMAEGASAIATPATFAASLLADAELRAGDTFDLPTLVQAVVVKLPAHFGKVPASAEEIDEAVTTAIKDITQAKPAPPDLAARLAKVIGRNVAALSAFLLGYASSIWGRGVEITIRAIGTWQSLQLSIAPSKTVPTLGGEQTGAEWLMFSQETGRPLPLNIEARAVQLTPMTCQLVIRADRVGLADPAGRMIEIQYADQHRSATTDEQGIARFGSVPIGALSQLTVRVQN